MQPSRTAPPVTEAQQRAAFAAMAWTGWTFEQAMADPLRSRLVSARANQQRNSKRRASSSQTEPWRQQAASPAPSRCAPYDRKRAAAGDFD